MTPRLRAIVLLLFLLFVPVLANCYAFIPTPTPLPTVSPTVVLPTSTPEPTVDPRLGGRLTVRLSHDLDRLTPLLPATDVEAGWIVGMLYSGLTRLDDHLQPQPDLAEAWAVSADGLTITFTLRPNLTWSDGTPLTADDVLFTYETLRAWEVQTGAQADLEDYVAAITAPTSQTVTLIMNRRLAGVLADVAFPILPRHIWGYLGPRAVQDVDLLHNPVGSGPFMLRDRRPGEALVLVPNPYYHGSTPFLGEIAFLVAPDPQVAEAAVRQGDLHVAQLPRACCDSLEQSPPRNPIRLGYYPAPQYTFVAFNLNEGAPMADPLLRQAWALALDKDALVAESTNGMGIALWSPILAPSYAFDDTLPRPAVDLEAARRLIADAGWEDRDGNGIVEKDGKPLQVRLFVRADVPERITATLLISETLGQIGMAVQVIPADFQSVIAAKLHPPYDFDALCMQWRNLGPDPDQFYLFHSSQAWQGADDTRENLYNFVGYRSTEADRLLVAGRDTYDPEQRRDIYVELQRLLAQDLPYYLLWGDPVYIAANARLTTDEGPINLETPNLFWNVEKWYWGE
jgi:peptide/nickel transport system substrate-binding protein